MNLLSKIKSNNFALWIAILSVLVQSFHSYTAFYNTSSLAGTGWGIAQAILFAFVIDAAIIFYTLRNRKDIALGFAVVMVIINAYYYYQHLGLSFQFAFGVFLSLIIPASVYFYSEEIKEEPVDFNSGPERAYSELQNEFDALRAERIEQGNIIKAGKAENKKLSDRIEEYYKNMQKQAAEYDEAIRLRDQAIQSESMTRQAFRRHLEQLGETLPEDKSLINVVPEKPHRITSATIPDDLPELQ